jgi:hypothetical protein
MVKEMKMKTEDFMVEKDVVKDWGSYGGKG